MADLTDVGTNNNQLDDISRFLNWLKSQPMANVGDMIRWVNKGQISSVTGSNEYRRWTLGGRPDPTVPKPSQIYDVAQDETGKFTVNPYSDKSKADATVTEKNDLEGDKGDTTKETNWVWDADREVAVEEEKVWSADKKTFSWIPTGNTGVPEIKDINGQKYYYYNGKALARYAGDADGGTSAYNKDSLDESKRQFDEELKWKQAESAQQQALEKEKLLASLSQPRDWIRYWNTAYGKNPEALAWLKKYDPTLNAEQTRSEWKTDVTNGYWADNQGTPISKSVFNRAVNAMGGDPNKFINFKWMPAVEGKPYLESTTGLTPTEVSAPSGQWWNRASESQQQGLLGYADWSAQKGKGLTGDDLLSLTNQMRPIAEPYQRSSWKATKQKGW